MKKIPDWRILSVMNNHPEARGNNTKFAICFYEDICSDRKIPATWENIKAISLEYNFETVMRARRRVVKSTANQLNNQTQYAR